jgi:DNA-binding NtrC family response regulator
MSGTLSYLRELNTALVIVSRDTGLVLEHSGELPVGKDGMVGRDWRDALGIPPDSGAVIAQSISAGVAASLPPTAIAHGADEDIVVGGMIVPENWRGEPVSVLFLRPLQGDGDALAPHRIEVEDVVAVLGLDRLEYSPTWGVPETERLLMDLRAGVRQVLRDHDWVGLPVGATLTLVLKGLEAEAALDVSRALLSHLHQRLGQQAGGAGYARACIGLTQRLEGQDALSALLSANGALLQAQSTSGERIRFASPWDPLGMAARALNANGVFRDARVDPVQEDYLRRLTGLGLEHMAAERCADEVLRLTLDQPGLAAAALLNTDFVDGLVITGAMRSGDGMSPGKLPRDMRSALRRLRPGDLEEPSIIAAGAVDIHVLPLLCSTDGWGALALSDCSRAEPGFRPSAAALHYMGMTLAARGLDRRVDHKGVDPDAGAVRELEKGIEGYVLDNMEGAIDQAVFLSRVDVPVAIVGPRGTGKHYLAQVIHGEAGGTPEQLVRIDCRGFRSRGQALTRLQEELERGENRTLVFKSPQLLHPEVQTRLARLLASRRISDEQGIRYLPANRYVALFPEDITVLVRRGELNEALASVFAGYPIVVPPLRERGRAILRWAHKILEQEAAQADRRIRGFTADAEQAMLRHPWPGNISEMREMIRGALERTEKEWITPVDLGIFTGISADGSITAPTRKPFLEVLQEAPADEPDYAPSAREELRDALAHALAAVLETGVIRPLGAWLDDEIVLAALERFGGDNRGAAEFLQTRSRNVGRWLPRISERQPERDASLMWQESGALARQWILETPPLELPPQQYAQDLLMGLVLHQCDGVSVADRARLMGVSTPTYQKRLKQILREASA